MKKVIFLVLLMPLRASGQITDTFESGLSNKWIQSIESRWEADTTESLNGNRSLHHVFDNSASGNDCIGISIENLHPEEGTVRWSFLLRHGYDPSSSNNWLVYLICDADPSAVVSGIHINGYALGVNLTGYDDTLKLWKIKDGTASVVVRTKLNWQNRIGTRNPANLVVERTASGIWSMSVKDYQNTLAADASGTDNELFATEWFMLNYRYTSTRDRLLWMDDLEIDGVFYEDKNPPEIISIETKGMQSLEILLDEEPDAGNMIPSNFYLNGETEAALYCQAVTTLKYLVSFPGKFKNKKINNLLITRLCDKRGNCINNMVVTFTPLWADPGDIIISEIMADPSPPLSLPQKEYLEITNRSNYPFNLKKWSLSFNEEDVVLPPINIAPGDYIILCSLSDTGLFRGYGKVAGIKPFPALTDDGKVLVLNDSLGNLIHGLEYSPDWYGNALKEGGGWSLEIIDADYPFFTDGNWEASSSKKGGTPGSANSASRRNEDLSFDGICNSFPADSNNILVTFSETLTGLAEFADEIFLNESGIRKIRPADQLLRQFIFNPDQPLLRGIIYSLAVPPDLTDFAGNSITRSTIKLGIPESSGKGNIVFNELLFNPLPGDPDYIELYNGSEKIIDVSLLYLTSINETGDTSELLPLSPVQRCFLPGSLYVITTDRDKIISRYYSNAPDNIFEIPQLSSMPDDKGHLLLLNNRAEIIDEVIYSEEMHHPLLSENEGIALEKIRPDISSSDPSGWHSASESSGWGTPGISNSVYVSDPDDSDIINLSSKRISPDNDGYEDILVIDFNLEGTGNVLSVTIFDETGAYVNKIAENLFAGTEATLVWDGTAGDGTLVDSGIYIILAELYNDKGKTKSWKKVCTVIRK
jgi:hypothetical protein